MAIINNKNSLLSHGNIAGRKTALDILETGLAAGDPFPHVLECMRLEGDKLVIGGERFPFGYNSSWPKADHDRPWRADEPQVFDLNKIENIYVVGGGKAAQRTAEAFEHLLGDRITGGHLNAKKGDSIRLQRVEVTLAGHPVPDEDSARGARAQIEVLKKATKNDLILRAMSGGATALNACPVPGVTIQDIQDVIRVLYFENGAPMPVANAVRGLFMYYQPSVHRFHGDAPMVTLSTSEQPLPPLQSVRSRPPEGVSEYQHAINLLKQYNSWEDIPETARQFLTTADPEHSTPSPREWWDKPVFGYRVCGPESMLDAALARAKVLGLNAQVLVSSMASLDARTIGEMAGYLARETIDHSRPLEAPCVWIFGGELVVPIGHEHGLGGRNQEFALASALHIDGHPQAVIASADSDGRDGPSENAGGIVDGYTMARTAELGIDVMDVLHRHDTDPALRALGDHIHTGVLHTNVQDLRVISVGG